VVVVAVVVVVVVVVAAVVVVVAAVPVVVPAVVPGRVDHGRERAPVTATGQTAGVAHGP
jgi:hypothetical protein